MTEHVVPPRGRRTGELSAPIVNLHDVRIPVTDVWLSKDWYMTVLGLVPVLDLEQEEGVVGAVLRHPLGFVVGLHHEPERAAALRGFAVLGLATPGEVQLRDWSATLEQQGLPHGPVEEGHLGWYMDVPDPDGILIRFHTGAGVAPNAEEA
jgi:catechol 2,3-dioxygenase-like lactoylglutathione lyase family enzyme